AVPGRPSDSAQEGKTDRSREASDGRPESRKETSEKGFINATLDRFRQSVEGAGKQLLQIDKWSELVPETQRKAEAVAPKIEQTSKANKPDSLRSDILTPELRVKK